MARYVSWPQLSHLLTLAKDFATSNVSTASIIFTGRLLTIAKMFEIVNSSVSVNKIQLHYRVLIYLLDMVLYPN